MFINKSCGKHEAASFNIHSTNFPKPEIKCDSKNSLEPVGTHDQKAAKSIIYKVFKKTEINNGILNP